MYNVLPRCYLVPTVLIEELHTQPIDSDNTLILVKSSVFEIIGHYCVLFSVEKDVIKLQIEILQGASS